MKILDYVNNISESDKYTSLSGWLYWPPNSFALTSLILERTGGYRILLNSRWNFKHENRKWKEFIEIESWVWKLFVHHNLVDIEGKKEIPYENFYKQIDERNINVDFPKQSILLESIDKIISNLDTDLNDLRAVNIEGDDTVLKLIKALITIHAICDQTCAGIGLLSSSVKHHYLYSCLANLLLNGSGSLSTFPKQICTVLPKMRTPQSGLTIRSFSHHITCHSSEVEVQWRAVPWPNTHNNALNILAVCDPQKVENNWFKPVSENFGSTRFFHLNFSSEESDFKPEKIISLMNLSIHEGATRIHFIVFPEVSLTEEDFDNLLKHLKKFKKSNENNPFPMPVVVAGVLRSSDTISHGMINEVRVAYYFTGNWYITKQWKHHRWKMDRNQILQYGLSHKFPTKKNWFEKIEIGQRKLTFFVPNGWLSFTPLICEDLAQLEPVSQLIRGVGPTLLFALLADGPQLNFRWSARYASIFADDPGTAVLTLTSRGMSNKSNSFEENRESMSQVVALWKDQITGFKEISIQSELNAFLLTISSDFVEEFTADGRSDNTQASTFKFEQLDTFKSSNTEIHNLDLNNESSKNWREENYRDWTDVREFSSMSFIIDSFLDCMDVEQLEQVYRWVLVESEENKESEKPNTKVKEYLTHVVGFLKQTLVDPKFSGILTQQINKSKEDSFKDKIIKNWPSSSFISCCESFKKFLVGYSQANIKIDDQIRLFEHLYEQVESELKNHPNKISYENYKYRMNRTSSLIITILLHNRIESFSNSRPGNKQLIDLFRKIEKVLEREGY